MAAREWAEAALVIGGAALLVGACAVATPSASAGDALDGVAANDDAATSDRPAPLRSCDGSADCPPPDCVGAECAPSAADGVKNGDETDVDCGGANAPKCAAGKACTQHSDCESAACPSRRCASSISCRQHFGGDTCGSGEVGDPNRQHEDCCTSIRPGNRPYRLDKYLITAGRMRAFVEAVNGDIRGWVRANRDKIAEWSDSWINSVPETEADLVQILGSGQGRNAYWGTPGQANGCYAKGQGGPTFWHPADTLMQHAGDARGWTKDELDVKTMNCAPRAVFVAFCAWDGGRLPTYEEWSYAIRGDESAATHPFPWGSERDLYARASYNFNYAFPPARAGIPRASDGHPFDRAYQVAPPGRFPAGAGPFGHADLLGLVETFIAGDPKGQNLDQGGVRQYAFQEAYLGVEAYGTFKSWGHTRSHYALGARCARPL